MVGRQESCKTGWREGRTTGLLDDGMTERKDSPKMGAQDSRNSRRAGWQDGRVAVRRDEGMSGRTAARLDDGIAVLKEFQSGGPRL